MSLGDRISQFDIWLLDQVFQPIADRLPERPSAVDIGMSFQLGSLLLYGAAVVAVLFIQGGSFFNSVLNVLCWCVGLAFFVSVCHVRDTIRMGYVNPLRIMLAGIRPLSIMFALYALWQALVAPPGLEMPFWFNNLSCLVFVVGCYLVSCSLPPPRQKQEAPSFEDKLSSVSTH